MTNPDFSAMFYIAVQDQLPTGSLILRAYKAVEGDLRIAVQLPDREHETRYGVHWIDHYPRIVEM